MRLAYCGIVCWALLPLTARGAEMTNYPRAELLIEPAELSRPEVAREFVLLDARDEQDYRREHIAGARWVDHLEWSKAFEDGQDAKGWSQRIGNLGIAANSKVVVYDGSAMKNAGRIWWILRYWGVGDVRLLNGGWKAWLEEGLPATAEVPIVSPAEFKAVPRGERLATKEQVLQSLQGRTLQIVDARSEKEFCGIDRQKNQRAGAIPGAKNLDWTELLDQKTHRVKKPQELATLFQQAGIDLKRPTVTHCQTGGRASVMVFAMELMGAHEVRNYYRGWSEWGNLDDTPIVVRNKDQGT